MTEVRRMSKRQHLDLLKSQFDVNLKYPTGPLKDHSLFQQFQVAGEHVFVHTVA